MTRFTSQNWKVFTLLVLTLFSLGLTSPAHASHFRFATISWTPTGSPGEVEFRVKVAFRRTFYSGPPNLGDVVVLDSFYFGDGNSANPGFNIVAVSPTEDFLVGELTIRHTYAGTGPFMAGLDDCCRISTLNNRRDTNFLAQTLVRPQSGFSSPVSTLIPVIVVKPGSASTFFIPASSPTGDKLRFRVSTDAEAGNGGGSPPGLSVNSNTGQVTWNNLGLNTTNPWTVQIIVEALDTAGNIKSSVPVDFLLQISGTVGNAPAAIINPPGTLTVVPGQTLSFTVTGSDPDAGDVLTLNTSGLPSGAVSSPVLPITGATGLSTTVTWTPTAQQAGTYTIAFSVTDSTGLQGQAFKTVIVSALNPVPSTYALLPLSRPVNSGAFNLVVSGINFVPGATLYWNGSPRTTTVNSSSQVTAQILASDLGSVGFATVKVVNPTPGGGSSNELVFAIDSAGGTPLLDVSATTITRVGNELVADITFINTGTAAMTGISVTSGILRITGTTTTLPISLGSLSPQKTVNIQLRFPGNAAAAGTRPFLTIGVVSDQGGSSISKRTVTVP